MLPEPPIATERAQRRVLLGCFALAALLLVYRGYIVQLSTKPSQQYPAYSQIDLNRANRVELLQVPGIGPSLADAILQRRNERGEFQSLEDLDDVKGIGDKTREKLRPWLSVGGREVVSRGQAADAEKLERKTVLPPLIAARKLALGETLAINRASGEELQRLPGIGEKMAQRILEVRAEKRFATIEDLRRVSGIGPKTLEKLRPYLTFEP